MAICPADFKPCIDDLCYGSGCMRMPGEPMLMRCPGGCGAYVAIDGSDDDDCECEPADDYDEDWRDDIRDIQGDGECQRD